MSLKEHLPQEISTDILSHLPFSDLLSISTVSHHTHAISQPLLYSSLTLTNRDGWTMPSSLQLLLRTLLSPGGETLATYVRSLHVRWGEWIHIETRSQLPLECPSGVALLAGAEIRLGLDQSPTSQMAQLVLLLHLLPRLHVLDIAPPQNFAGECDVFYEFLEAHSAALPTKTLPLGLQQLREFRFSIPGRVSPMALLTIFNLPCIRRIDVGYNGNYSFPFHAFGAAAATSTVTHLRIPLADLSEEALKCMLKIPIALTHFSYAQVVGNLKPDILQELQASLQHLHFERPGTRWPIGSLRGWPALRTVSCSLILLLGNQPNQSLPRLTDVLPVSLRELVILQEYHYDATVQADQLEELVKQKEAIVPGLERLVVPFSDRKMWRDGQVTDTLRVACEAAAVELADRQSPPWKTSCGRFLD